MIILKVKVGEEYRNIKVNDDIIFNSMLSSHPDIIKKLIRSVCPTYKINKSFFTIINQYVELDSNDTTIYTGLIVRTNLFEYAVLYLEGNKVDDIRIMDLIKEFIYDVDDVKPENVNINKMEIDRRTFLLATRNI